jgi:hypothetical protein
MPPEQFGGRTVPASDLYSLGATLIYLVTGTHPADLPQKDLRIQFESLVSLGSSLTQWLKWMTEPSLDRRLSSANAALQALNDSQPPSAVSLIVDKPAGSKIQLSKDWDLLEISIPPSGFKLSMLFTGAFAIAWNSFILFWTIGALAAPFPANVPFALFSLPFWFAGFFMISNLMFGLFGRIRLRVDSQQITYKRDLLGWTFHKPQPSLKQNISKLVYIPQHFTKDSEGNRTTVPAQLDIWVETKKYSLGGNTGIVLSEAELEWLAHELRDWLNMPIQRE